MYEKNKYEVIRDVVNQRKSKERAEVELNLSRRQINRLIHVYHNEGRKGFRHKNTNRKPATTISKETRTRIVQLYKTKYEDFNYTHFLEKLIAEEKMTLSYSSLRTILNEKNEISPRATRQTKRVMAKRLKKKQFTSKGLTKREAQQLTKMDDIEPHKAHPSRPRKKYMGELLQMDASEHVWFGKEKTHLHAAIDDCTGRIVGAYFDTQETLNGYYTITRQLIESYGIPYEIRTDNRTIFMERKNEGNPDQRSLVQYRYACQTLGIKLDTTSIPQAKGRIERLFGTLQDRMIKEMRLQNIQTIEEANRFLIDYIPIYNQQFALFNLNPNMNVFEKPSSNMNLDYILARFSYRKIQHGHAIKYHHQYYRLLDKEGQVKLLRPKTDILVIETMKHELYASYEDQVFYLEAIPRHESHSKNFDLLQAKSKPRKTYIPPMSHPWKSQSYQRYLYKLKRKESATKD